MRLKKPEEPHIDIASQTMSYSQCRMDEITEDITNCRKFVLEICPFWWFLILGISTCFIVLIVSNISFGLSISRAFVLVKLLPLSIPFPEFG